MLLFSDAKCNWNDKLAKLFCDHFSDAFYVEHIWIANLQKIISFRLKFRSNRVGCFKVRWKKVLQTKISLRGNEKFILFVYLGDCGGHRIRFRNPFLSQNHFQCFMCHKTVQKWKIKFSSKRSQKAIRRMLLLTFQTETESISRDSSVLFGVFSIIHVLWEASPHFQHEVLNDKRWKKTWSRSDYFMSELCFRVHPEHSTITMKSNRINNLLKWSPSRLLVTSCVYSKVQWTFTISFCDLSRHNEGWIR